MASPKERSPLYDALPLRLIRTSDLDAELYLIAASVDTTAWPVPEPDSEEWKEIIGTLLSGPMEQVGTAARVRRHSKRHRGALGRRAWFLHQEIEALPPDDQDKWRLAPFDWGEPRRLSASL